MLFFIDEVNKLKIDYKYLVEKVGKKYILNKYIYTKNIEDIFINLVSALYYAYDVELIDGDFSSEELSLLKISNESLNLKYKINKQVEIRDVEQLIEQIKLNQDKVKIGIYSSGTTGLPKRFEHSLKSLMRNIKISEKHSKDIWGFAYNITHFAGVQVFLQALMNKNTIVNMFDKNKNFANDLLEKYSCTCISATPTFYRNFIFNNTSINEVIKNVTFGGEKFDNDLLLKAKEKFPKAIIRNIYASTEIGSLLSGNGEAFMVPDNLKNFIRISKNNHLLVHKTLLMKDNISEEWYDTNDIVSLNSEGSFKILNRDSDFINVGGYKVNPLEVEKLILEIEGVLDAVVISRDNSVLGKILVANIKKDAQFLDADLKKNIIKELKNKLQPFKVPRIINFVEKIEYNRSGKKVRL